MQICAKERARVEHAFAAIKSVFKFSAEQYHQIVLGINGTVGNEDKLQGKTRADVPDNRQYLLRFLEEKGWLYEQFKI